MKLFPLLAVIVIFLFGCSSPNNNIEKNLKKLDEQYGYCDNPHRDLSKREYKICKDKERAAGGDFEFKNKSLREIVLGSGGSDGSFQSIGQIQMVNVHLWNGALETVIDYPIKNLDSSGGYIETEWITQANNPSQRCVIKINITSRELVSNGVRSKIICQNKINSEWINDELSYDNEAKQLTISILNKASKSYQVSINE